MNKQHQFGIKVVSNKGKEMVINKIEFSENSMIISINEDNSITGETISKDQYQEKR